MENDDSTQLGKLMCEGHTSLRDDFEVCGDALNVIVECAMEHQAFLGARMTGAGCAGCAIALVEKGREQEFIDVVGVGYRKRMNVQPQLYVCKTSAETVIKPV